MYLNISLRKHRARVQVLKQPKIQAGSPVPHPKALISSLIGFKNFTISRSVQAQERIKNSITILRISHSDLQRLSIMDLKLLLLNKLRMGVFQL